MAETSRTLATPEALSPDTARAILMTGDSTGNLYYDTLVGVDDYPPRWNSPTAAEEGHDVSAAR